MSDNSPKSFLLATLSIIILLSTAYYACVRFQVGRNVKAEWWVKNLYIYKDYLAAQVDSPRIIIAGGSNALFGINSKIIEEQTGYRVINVSSHAGLDIDFHYRKIREYMKRGDIVVMPLEGSFHIRNTFSDWFVNNMLAWGWDDYLGKLNWYEWIKVVLSVPLKRVYQGLLSQKGNKPVLDIEMFYARVRGPFFEKEEKWNGYSHLSLNRYGELIAGGEPTGYVLKLHKDGVNYFHDGPIAERFVKIYNKILDHVRKNDGKLVLTWPVTMRNKYFDLSKKSYQEKMTRRRSQLADNSIAIACNPALFHFGVNFFFDTESHLNSRGAVIRSENLSLCLNRVLSDSKISDMSYEEALNRVSKKEANFAE